MKKDAFSAANKSLLIEPLPNDRREAYTVLYFKKRDRPFGQSPSRLLLVWPIYRIFDSTPLFAFFVLDAALSIGLSDSMFSSLKARAIL